MKKTLALLLAALMLIPGAYAEQNTGDTMNKTIYLAGGCFWGVEHLMSLVPGVKDAVSGYANGTLENPTYEQVIKGDTGHRETVKVTYNPAEVSLEALLKLYFSVVDPLTPNKQGNDVGTQYQAGIYYDDADSKTIVENLAKQEAAKHAAFHIEIGELQNFFLAEDYHQDYLVKNPAGYCHIPLSAFEEAKKIGQETEELKAQYRTITPKDALQLKQENPAAVYLDVRTPAEYRDGHLPEAVNLPLDELQNKIGQAYPDKNALLLVYCRSGARSRTASNLLVQMGYTQVYDLGGIINWPYDIVR